MSRDLREFLGEDLFERPTPLSFETVTPQQSRQHDDVDENFDLSRKSHILRLYSPDVIKKLFAHALMIDIDDNNEKVNIIKEIVGDDFMELGPGTNRLGLLGPDGYCHKIALDRRGIVDNITELKRSPELEWVSPHVYESNGVILVAENVELMSKEDFRANRDSILAICEQLARSYIFTDIGYAEKNFCNWGIRKNGDLVVLDIGYLIPRLGNEEAMRCPVCGKELGYNSLYTHFVCHHCQTNFSFIDIYRRLTDRLESKLYQEMTGFDLPDFSQFNNSLYNNSILKGGHIYHGIGEAKPEPFEDSGNDDAGCLRYEDIQDILNATGQAH